MENNYDSDEELINEIKEEKMLIESWVKKNPYPSFDKVQKLIEFNIQLWSEYGEFNHTCCKIIYENPSNKDLVIEMGKKIFKRGGGNALQSNFYIIASFYRASGNITVMSQKGVLERYFEGVTPLWSA